MMTALSIIILVLALFFLIVRAKLYSLRQEKRNELKAFYNELELQFVKDGVRLDGKAINFLQSFKFTANHPEFLDIQILSLIHNQTSDVKKIHSIKNEFDTVRQRLSTDSMDIIQNFEKECQTLIKLSALKPDFVYWMFKKVIYRLYISLKRNSLKPFKGLFSRMNEVKKEFTEIVFFGQNATFNNNRKFSM